MLKLLYANVKPIQLYLVGGNEDSSRKVFASLIDISKQCDRCSFVQSPNCPLVQCVLIHLMV